MRIHKIERINSCRYIILFKPNWLEKLFGYKEKKLSFYRTGNTYFFGGGNVWINEDGHKLGNHSWIGASLDAFLRRIELNIGNNKQ